MDKKDIQELIDYIDQSLAESDKKWWDKEKHHLIIGFLQGRMEVVKDKLNFKMNKL